MTVRLMSQSTISQDAPVPQGKVLQVVSTTKTDTFSTSSTSYVDITGVSVTITPSSSSNKILVLAETAVGSTNEATIFVQVTRDGTALNVGDASGSRTQATFSVFSHDSLESGGWVSVVNGNSTFVDSPNSTSSLTYKLQTKVSAGTGYIGRSGEDLTSAYYARTPTNLILMEIAG